MALTLAWESMQAGSVPVGSVLTDENGTIVASGRNKSQEPVGLEIGLSGTYIAHAEINTLAWLSPGDWDGYTLWSSLEPCFLCTSAAMHSHVGTIRFLASDPVVDGVEGIPHLSSWAQARWPSRIGPLDSPFARLAALLAVAWTIQRRPEGVVFRAYRGTDPELLEIVMDLLKSPIWSELRKRTFEDGLQELWTVLT